MDTAVGSFMRKFAENRGNLLTLIVLLAGCHADDRSHYADWGSPAVKALEPDRLTAGTPLQFLEWLCEPSADQQMRAVSFGAQHYGWIQADDIPALIELLPSLQPCRPVLLTKSSYFPLATSTKGKEAAFMIEGFRQGHYPPDMSSGNWPHTEEEQRRFDEWIDAFRMQYHQDKQR